MDGKLEKHFQNAEKENKELKLSYFTDFKMSIFAHVYNSEIRLRLTIGGILQSVASYNWWHLTIIVDQGAVLVRLSSPGYGQMWSQLFML